MRFVSFLLALTACASPLAAQDLSVYSAEALDAELARAATAREGVMVPMRDGVGLSTDIYTPRCCRPAADDPVEDAL